MSYHSPQPRPYFSDHGRIIREEISAARSSVEIAVAWITLAEYASVFAQLLQRNIKVRLICTSSQQIQGQHDILSQLQALGLQVRIMKLPRGNFMHHKFCIIDKSTVIAGSFNWTKAAEGHAEDITVYPAGMQTEHFSDRFDFLWDNPDEFFRQLGNPPSCPCQRGARLINLLVFESSPEGFSAECYGDLLRFCTCCHSAETIASCIQDPWLWQHLNQDPPDHDYGDSKSERDFWREQDWRLQTHFFRVYRNGTPCVHAIGLNARQLMGRHFEDVYTHIAWKHSFAAGFVADRYDGHYGAFY